MLLSSYFPSQLLPMAPVLVRAARGLVCSPRCLPFCWFLLLCPCGHLPYLCIFCHHGTVPWDQIRTTNNILRCCTCPWCLCLICYCPNRPLCILHISCASNCRLTLSLFWVASSLALDSLLWAGANYCFLLLQVLNFAPPAGGFTLWSRPSAAKVCRYAHSAWPSAPVFWCSCPPFHFRFGWLPLKSKNCI